MGLRISDGSGGGVPVKSSHGASSSCVVLKTVQLWGSQVPTLVLGGLVQLEKTCKIDTGAYLGHLDLPAPGGGGGGGVYVNVYCVTRVRCRDKDMLASVIATDDRGGATARVGHRESVSHAVPVLGTHVCGY